AGTAKAQAQLDDALESGIPAVAFVSTADLPHWHLPADQSGRTGQPITVYGKVGDRYLIDEATWSRPWRRWWSRWTTGACGVGRCDVSTRRSSLTPVGSSTRTSPMPPAPTRRLPT